MATMESKMCIGNNSLESDADGFNEVVIREILNEAGNDCQNDFGWTPLMRAIRNNNVKTVEILLGNGYSPDQSTFQGISAITLAAAMSLKMFEIVYEACPSALEYAKRDSVGPLCVAAMKNDKELFFRLVELGLKVSEADEYTHIMMRQSREPDIAKLAKQHVEIDDYWEKSSYSIDLNDISGDEFEKPQMSSTLYNIECSEESEDAIVNNVNEKNYYSGPPYIRVIPSPSERKKNFRANVKYRLSYNQLAPAPVEILSGSAISPTLAYTREPLLPVSPDPRCDEDSRFLPAEDTARRREDRTPDSDRDEQLKFMHKYRTNRPPDLQISKEQPDGVYSNVDDKYLANDENNINGFTGAVLSNKTPIEPRTETPPAGFILDADQQLLALLLKRFGLTHFIYTFLEQEVDLDLFLTLNDDDLQEIGIQRKSDRIIILSVIAECNRYKI